MPIAGCRAEPEGDGRYLYCARCGTAWAKDGARPPCTALTIVRLRDALWRAIQIERSAHRRVLAAMDEGLPADPVPTLQHAAELEGALLLLNRCTSSNEIMNILKRLARADREVKK